MAKIRQETHSCLELLLLEVYFSQFSNSSDIQLLYTVVKLSNSSFQKKVKT